MGVLKSRRGQGLGRRILDVTISRAWEIGLDRIDLRVYASNTVAVRLYERAEFRIEGVQRRARYLDDIYDDMMLMALLRNTSAD
jgi:RimJ/RimL family protein N-acetyltransferase